MFAKGGAGGLELAEDVLGILEKRPVRFTYPDDAPVADKVRAVCKNIYGAADVAFSAAAKKQLAELDAGGFGRLPVCIAKTQYSFSDDASLLAAPSGFTMTVRELRLSAGAGFVVVVMGNIMTMPGLPKKPAAEGIDVDETASSAACSERFQANAAQKSIRKQRRSKGVPLERRCFLHLFSGRFTAPYRENPSNAGFWGFRRTPPGRPPP